eukprot:14313476-Alexandrium_andersonii.AAC.1
MADCGLRRTAAMTGLGVDCGLGGQDTHSQYASNSIRTPQPAPNTAAAASAEPNGTAELDSTRSEAKERMPAPGTVDATAGPAGAEAKAQAKAAQAK